MVNNDFLIDKTRLRSPFIWAIQEMIISGCEIPKKTIMIKCDHDEFYIEGASLFHDEEKGITLYREETEDGVRYSKVGNYDELMELHPDCMKKLLEEGVRISSPSPSRN